MKGCHASDRCSLIAGREPGKGHIAERGIDAVLAGVLGAAPVNTKELAPVAGEIRRAHAASPIAAVALRPAPRAGRLVSSHFRLAAAASFSSRSGSLSQPTTRWRYFASRARPLANRLISARVRFGQGSAGPPS